MKFGEGGQAGQHRPDLVIVFTELDGPARVRPRWPVLWAVPEAHAKVLPPFAQPGLTAARGAGRARRQAVPAEAAVQSRA